MRSRSSKGETKGPPLSAAELTSSNPSFLALAERWGFFIYERKKLMANIVGLNSTQDDPAAGGRRLRQGTVLDDGSNMRMPGLKPVASPVDIYHRPAQAPIDNNLKDLAEGLSMLNPALAKWAKADDKEEINKDALAAKYQPMNREQLSEALKTDPDLRGKMAQQFAGNIYAEKAGLDLRGELVQLYNDPERFDKQNGDFNKVATEYVAKRGQELFANNPSGAAKFYEGSASVVHSLQSEFLSEKVKQGEVQRAQMTQDGAANIVRQAINTDQSPEGIIREVGEYMRTNKAVMNVPYKEQMQQQITAMQPLLQDMEADPAKRNKIYKAVEALYTMPRKGEDGVERRLIDQPGGLGDLAKGQLADFKKKRDELNDKHLVTEKLHWEVNAEHDPAAVDPRKLEVWSKENGDAYSPAEMKAVLAKRETALRQLAEKGLDEEAKRKATQMKTDVDRKNLERLESFDLVLPQDAQMPQKEFFRNDDLDAVKPYKAAEQQQRAVELYRQKLGASKTVLINSKKMTQEQAEDWARGQELATLSQNGIVPDDWKQELQAGANTLTTATLSNSKEMPQPALKAYERYKLLASKAPNLLSQVADERTRAIFDNAMLVDGSPTDQLRGALVYYGNRDEKREQVSLKSVKETVGSLAGATKWGWIKSVFGGAEVPDNFGALLPQVEKRAAFRVQAYNENPQDAVVKAAKSLRSHYAIVNGTAVLTDDKRLPPNFEHLAERYLRNLVLDVGAERLGVEDHRELTLQPVPDGSFQLYNKKHGYMVSDAVPIEWRDGTTKDARFITPEMIVDIGKNEREMQESRAVRNAQNRLKPLFVIPGTSVGMSRPGSYSPEEVAQINLNIEEAAKPAPKGSNKDAVKAIDAYTAAHQSAPSLLPDLPPVEPFIVTKEQRRKDWEARKKANKKDAQQQGGGQQPN